jgi:DNA-directed RNA polymerase specialized sigma24 family protein
MKAWLTRILYNFFFDSYARNKRVVAAEDIGKYNDDGAAEQNFFDSLTANQPGPEKQILQQELEAKIGAALRRIPEEFCAPIVLVDMGDFSYAEAAGNIILSDRPCLAARGRKAPQSFSACI